MFSGLTESLIDEVQAITDVVTFTDHVRGLLNDVTNPLDPLAELRKTAPRRLVWQVYDHCAALTRLYAVYATFIEEMATEYLRLLPTLYEQYDQLPEPILRQHRLGIAQILLKLGDSGPYRDLQERTVVGHLAGGLAGDRPYDLLPNAFLLDRQNYRLDALIRLFGYLGIDDLGARLQKDSELQQFLRERRGDSTTLDAELSAFIQRRNEAAHSHVDEIVGLEEFRLLAEFVQILGGALAKLLSNEVIRHRVVVGQAPTCGVVEETHFGGLVVVARMRTVSFAKGDELLILDGDRFIALAKVQSIELDDVECDHLNAVDGQEVGIRLSARCIPGNTLARLTDPTQSTPAQMPLFASEEYPEPETSEPVLEDGAGLSPGLEADADVAEETPPRADQ